MDNVSLIVNVNLSLNKAINAVDCDVNHKS
ncbi:hypothetical protein Q5A_010530 [Serratia inhibens PRI-2C]|nr:hypothetical protein Q5A_010530 [Serratia inhibens PRI-2C]